MNKSLNRDSASGDGFVSSIGSRGLLFRFDGTNSPFGQPTFVYVIIASRRLFICDTHTGPLSMAPVMHHLTNLLGPDLGGRGIIVFNSHFDWDHVWGNAFVAENWPETLIISHQLCRALLADDHVWDHMASANAECMNGQVKRRLPDLVFQDCLEFPKDGVRFFHTPGHTADSASCLDTVDNALFAGDNLEAPHPWLAWHNLDEYLETLDICAEMKPSVVIGAHNGVMTKQQISDCRDYVAAVAELLEQAGSANDQEELIIPDLPSLEGNLQSLLASLSEETGEGDSSSYQGLETLATRLRRSLNSMKAASSSTQTQNPSS